jgi:glycosyltransferase involved in cell wall biosynthesis
MPRDSVERTPEAAPAATLAGKRIVFVLAGQLLGGAERNALELAIDLKRRHASVVEICALDDRAGEGPAAAARHGIPWRTIRVPWSRGRARKAWELARAVVALRRLRPDVLISTTNLPNVVCGLTWRAAGASLAVWNQEDALGTVRIRRALFRRALAATPLVVTLSHYVRDWLVEEWDADPGRIHVIYSKVVLEPPRAGRPAWRARLGLSPEDVVACMIAHLHAGKDHATALRAWRSVVDRFPVGAGRPILLLAGRDAGGEAAVKALAFDLDLRDHVRALGSVDDISGLLGACDFAIFSSRSEGLGRGATEPMAAGLAVAATDVPGIREALGEPGRELLAPPGDDEALAEVILRLATDDALRARVGAANAALIRERQSGAATSEVYASLLAGALGGDAARRRRARAPAVASGFRQR